MPPKTLLHRLGKFQAGSGLIDISFRDGAWRHKRQLRAVLDPAGNLDRKATKARADELAAGVARKRALGIIA